MYQILSKLENRFSKKQWLVMVEQAHDAKKITDDEYRLLVSEKKENV
jgi:hypothetical protein